MINLRYVIHPASCGYFCLKHIICSRKFKRIGYMSLYDMKDVFTRNNYYCFCCRMKDLNNVKRECVTLINIKNSCHYVVIKRISEKFVYVYDPLFLFERKLKKDKFMKKWSKICLFYRKI